MKDCSQLHSTDPSKFQTNFTTSIPVRCPSWIWLSRNRYNWMQLTW
jgi:hypothetical protein